MAFFTQNWSSSLRDFLDSYYRIPVRTPMTCLEIGSFEGRGYDRLCKHPDIHGKMRTLPRRISRKRHPLMVSLWGNMRGS